jgi:hypothetical protein
MTLRPSLSSLLLAALLAASTTLPGSTAVAQTTEQRLDKLEQDVQDLGRKFDALLELLQKQQAAQTGSAATAASPSSSDQAAASPAAPASLRFGALYLDVYTLPSPANGEPSVASKDKAAASAIVEPGDYRFGMFSDQQETKHLTDYADSVVLSWNGVLRIESAGPHSFLIAIKKKGVESIENSCRASLVLSGREVAKVGSNLAGYSATTRTAQGTVLLEPGYYDFDFRLGCAGNGPTTRNAVSADIWMAGPDDRAAKPIPPQLLGIKE